MVLLAQEHQVFAEDFFYLAEVPVGDARHVVDVVAWLLDVTVLAIRAVYAESIHVVVALSSTI